MYGILIIDAKMQKVARLGWTRYGLARLGMANFKLRYTVKN